MCDHGMECNRARRELYVLCLRHSPPVSAVCTFVRPSGALSNEHKRRRPHKIEHHSPLFVSYSTAEHSTIVRACMEGGHEVLLVQRTSTRMYLVQRNEP